jgi:outer membrane protein OmpA-like peptidoglycan-associated protein
MAGVQYAYDFRSARVRSVTKTVTREVVQAPTVGRVRGVVRDAVTKEPLRDAIVKYVDRQATPQSSSADGTFVSYDFTPGPIRLEVSRDDYEVTSLQTVAPVRGEAPVEVLLTRRPPAAAPVRVRVADAAGQPLVSTVRFTANAGAVVDADPDGAGGFNAKLQGGDYFMDVVADGYLARPRAVSVNAGTAQALEVVLSKKPKTAHVTLNDKEIQVKSPVRFGNDDALLKADAQPLLDEVVDVLTRNPQIKKLRIEAHTDNQGDAGNNITLTKARANVVMGYLIRQGVDPTRLESEGFGGEQPLVPNLSPGGRSKNRRVVFKIVAPGPTAAN